jgi:proteasome accessory factor C
MNKIDKIYALHRLLKGRKTPISRLDLLRRLDLPRSTATRLIGFCRNFLHMPIDFNKEMDGYLYEEKERDTYELPGLWFNPSELIGLLTSHHMLEKIQPGIFQQHLAPLQKRIEQLIEHRHAGSKDIFKRIRILPMANRVAKLEDFQKVADALVSRKRLRLQYSSRSKNEVTERWISPQRLVYYRDNWYLDAWCHLRNDLRLFALDSMNVAESSGIARDVPDRQIDEHVMHTYGIFSGRATNKAVIHFSGEAARWVADEQWHPEQESRHLAGGRWELVIPYGNPTELIRDILKYGPEAEVISPPELRVDVTDKLSQALRKYKKIRKT